MAARDFERNMVCMENTNPLAWARDVSYIAVMESPRRLVRGRDNNMSEDDLLSTWAQNSCICLSVSVVGADPKSCSSKLLIARYVDSSILFTQVWTCALAIFPEASKGMEVTTAQV